MKRGGAGGRSPPCNEFTRTEWWMVWRNHAFACCIVWKIKIPMFGQPPASLASGYRNFALSEQFRPLSLNCLWLCQSLTPSLHRIGLWVSGSRNAKEDVPKDPYGLCRNIYYSFEYVEDEYTGECRKIHLIWFEFVKSKSKTGCWRLQMM